MNAATFKPALFFLICTVVLVLANFCLLYYYQYSITLLAIFCGLLLVVLISRSMRCSQIDRRKVLALLILIAITVVYYVASLQVDGTLLLFIRGHVHHQFFGWAIPVTSFSSIEPFFAMISAPILGYFWLKLTAKNKDWSVCSKVICGMLLTSTCFIFFSAATLVQFSRTLPLFFVVLGNIFLGLSDSFEVPIVMSAVSRYAPPQLLGTLMGVVFMRNAIAGYFASLVGRLSSFRGSVAKSVQGYLFSFLLVFVLCVLVTILLWVLAPHITRLFEGKNIMKKTMGGLEHANN